MSFISTEQLKQHKNITTYCKTMLSRYYLYHFQFSVTIFFKFKLYDVDTVAEANYRACTCNLFLIFCVISITCRFPVTMVYHDH